VLILCIKFNYSDDGDNHVNLVMYAICSIKFNYDEVCTVR
jgi:hypothetical protein